MTTQQEDIIMTNPFLAAVANFFFPGAGYLLVGTKRVLAVLWLAGAVGLTWVEFGIREPEPTLWAIMFVSVFAINTAFAVDVYRTAKLARQTPA
jgi:hypothetical protein